MATEEASTLADVWESLQYYIEYVEYFEADMEQTLTTLLTGLRRAKKQLRRAVAPHPAPPPIPWAQLISTFKQVKQVFPTLTFIGDEWTGMEQDLQQMENALRFLQHQANDIRVALLWMSP